MCSSTFTGLVKTGLKNIKTFTKASQQYCKNIYSKHKFLDYYSLLLLQLSHKIHYVNRKSKHPLCEQIASARLGKFNLVNYAGITFKTPPQSPPTQPNLQVTPATQSTVPCIIHLQFLWDTFIVLNYLNKWQIQ